MWEEALRVAVSNGIFAVLFCSLLIYELKITGRRENKYQRVIEGLTQSLSSLKAVESNLESVERLLEDVLGSLLSDINQKPAEMGRRKGKENECAEKIEGVVCKEKA